jgi:hypothetical protein
VPVEGAEGCRSPQPAKARARKIAKLWSKNLRTGAAYRQVRERVHFANETPSMHWPEKKKAA